MYASTSRPVARRYAHNGNQSTSGGPFQVARLANPLVNELIIGTGSRTAGTARTRGGRRSSSTST